MRLFLSLLLVVCLSGLFVAPASALKRAFPQDSVQTKIDAGTDAFIVIGSKTFPLAPGVLVYSQNNTTLVRGAIPFGVFVRVQRDFQGAIRRIWVLNEDEIIPPGLWEKLFGTSDIPTPADPTTTAGASN